MSHTPAHEELKEQAALYALGALETAEARDFERHLAEGCEACAAELRDFEGVAAQFALASAPARPPAGAREKLLSRIAAAAEEPRPEVSPEGAPAPDVLALAPDLLVVRRDAGEWEETPDPGVFVKMLFVDREHDTVTRLVRLDPGARIPSHRHLGYEQCLIVEGGMRAGHLHLRAGDFNCAAPGTIHEEISTEEGALLLIVAPANYEVLGGKREHGFNG
ncbi:MAG TPA: cupin domain-containing protein [Pyrinomonadaceae bacterium]